MFGKHVKEEIRVKGVGVKNNLSFGQLAPFQCKNEDTMICNKGQKISYLTCHVCYTIS